MPELGWHLIIEQYAASIGERGESKHSSISRRALATGTQRFLHGAPDEIHHVPPVNHFRLCCTSGQHGPKIPATFTNVLQCYLQINTAFQSIRKGEVDCVSSDRTESKTDSRTRISATSSKSNKLSYLLRETAQLLILLKARCRRQRFKHCLTEIEPQKTMHSDPVGVVNLRVGEVEPVRYPLF